jgi:hypothetical protein
MATERSRRQEAQYCGHHHFHCHAIFVWTGIYVLITRLDFAEDGSRQDEALITIRVPFDAPLPSLATTSTLLPIQGFKGKNRRPSHLSRRVRDEISFIELSSIATFLSSGSRTNTRSELSTTETGSCWVAGFTNGAYSELHMK